MAIRLGIEASPVPHQCGNPAQRRVTGFPPATRSSERSFDVFVSPRHAARALLIPYFDLRPHLSRIPEEVLPPIRAPEPALVR